MRRCCVNFQCRGVLVIWIIVGQGPIALAVGASGGCLKKKFSDLSLLFSFSLSLARYRLIYFLKGRQALKTSAGDFKWVEVRLFYCLNVSYRQYPAVSNTEEERKEKQLAPTTSTVDPCPTII